MNRRCEIYVPRTRHFHFTGRKVTYNQRTLALISLFHPSSNGMMFGTLVPFGFARATFDIVSSGMKIRILVLVIVVGAAHFCGLWYEYETYRYISIYETHTHSFYRRSCCQITFRNHSNVACCLLAPRPYIVSVLISIGV